MTTDFSLHEGVPKYPTSLQRHPGYKARANFTFERLFTKCLSPSEAHTGLNPFFVCRHHLICGCFRLRPPPFFRAAETGTEIGVRKYFLRGRPGDRRDLGPKPVATLLNCPRQGKALLLINVAGERGENGKGENSQLTSS